MRRFESAFERLQKELFCQLEAEMEDAEYGLITHEEYRTLLSLEGEVSRCADYRQLCLVAQTIYSLCAARWEGGEAEDWYTREALSYYKDKLNSFYHV